jgi:CheY-like chemotaxis protein
VLLVDDEALVRRSCARALRSGGFEVVTVATGEEAVDVYSRRATEVSAVILDLNMPGLSGSQTFDKLLRMNPAVKVIVLSGIADRERTALLEQGAVAVLSKPCPMDILIQSIRDALRIR